ncbi:MAG: divalent-cation tolerance protein CutA [Thermoanaerobaculia bacterium]|nr:divalent-cation tolerance protein CutA [Thermoanaerobaculia bacterium]
MRIVLTTIDTRESAETLAKKIVEQRLAACVNVIDKVISVYWWESEVQTGDEWLLMIKTMPGHLDALEEFITEHHPYDLPEFVVLTPGSVSKEYRDWVESSTR